MIKKTYPPLLHLSLGLINSCHLRLILSERVTYMAVIGKTVSYASDSHYVCGLNGLRINKTLKQKILQVLQIKL